MCKSDSQVPLFFFHRIDCGTVPVLNIRHAISQQRKCSCVSLSVANCMKSHNVLLRPPDTQPAGCWEALGQINHADFLNSTSKHTLLVVMELLIVVFSQAVPSREGSLWWHVGGVYFFFTFFFLPEFETFGLFYYHFAQTYAWKVWLKKESDPGVM